MCVCVESPLTVDIVDSRSVMASGSGLTHAVAGQLTTFAVNTGQRSTANDNIGSVQVFLKCTQPVTFTSVADQLPTCQTDPEL